MKKLFALLGRAPRLTGALAIAVAVVAVSAATYAWGPDRPTFTEQTPANYVTFNSITNNSAHGDERNFVQIREVGKSNWGEEVKLTPGKEYEVYNYFHNNAASNLNDKAHNYKGIAKDVKMRTQMPVSVKAGEKGRITSFITASNATPKEVWDEAYVTADSTMQLSYIYGSAKVTSNGKVNGKTLDNSLYTTGAPLGYDALDGTLPGCNEFAGYVTYRFKVDQPNFEVTKDVSIKGENKYSDATQATAGAEVEYKIKYKNIGTVQQDNVVIRDKLPTGISYVKGSTQISNSKTGHKWSSVSEDTITGRGINVGSYAPGGATYVKFTATLPANDTLAKCGTNTLVNTATAETSSGSKSDTATVTVTKKCDETVKEIEVCDLDSKKVITINEKDFDSTKHSKDRANCETTPENPVTPETPTELPTTGPAAGILTILGLGGLTAAISYAVRRRI